MSRYEEMENFVRIVEAGSITGAAKQMRIAKSAVSRRLKEMEARLGIQLIIRSTRKLTMTDTGRALYDRAVSLLADWEETEAVAGDTQSAFSGTLKMTAPLSFGVAHLGPIIVDFMKKHPQIRFDIDFSDRVVDLVSEGLDLAIRIGSMPDSNLIARKFSDISRVACASPDYLKRHGFPLTPKELEGHKEIAYGYRASSIHNYTAPNGKTGSVELAPRLHATSGEFMRDVALAGEGVLMIPRFIMYKNLNNGSLVEIMPGYEWDALAVYVVYPPTRHLSARVRAFVDFLVERCQGTPYWEKRADISTAR